MCICINKIYSTTSRYNANSLALWRGGIMCGRWIKPVDICRLINIYSDTYWVFSRILFVVIVHKKLQ